MKTKLVKSYLGSLLVASASILCPTTTAFAVQKSQNPYVKPEPEYAKWGKLALAETQKRYPRVSVVDYLHVRREVLSSSKAQEVFKFWLKDDNREFGVYVRILFNTKTEQILKMSFQETSR